MLTLEKMQKVRVIAPKDDVKRVVQALYGFGAIQVQECKIAELDAPLEDFAEISEMLVRLRAEERALALEGSPEAREGTLPEIRRAYDALGLGRLDELRQKTQKVEAEIQQLEERMALLMPFRNLGVEFETPHSEKLKLAYFELKNGTERRITAGLQKAPHEILFVQDGKRLYALLAYDVRHAERVQLLIAKNSVATFELPKPEGSFSDEIALLEGRLSKARVALAAMRAELGEYRKANGGKILMLKEQLKVASLKAELPFKFGRTGHFSVVEGWIEQKNSGGFGQELAESLPAVLVETVRTQEVPPSKLDNPKLIRPFEFMVEFFSLPKSYELDPTLFISITYPFFFGMIMGDIGYGMLSLFAALLIKLRSQSDLMRRIGGMLALSASSSIVFGVIFGEFFGLEHIFGIELVPLIHRAKEVEEMFNIAILVGVLHLALGFLIGAYTGAKEGHMKHAAAKFAWLVLEVSLIASIINVTEVPLLHIFEPLKHAVPLEGALLGLLAGMGAVAVFEHPTHLLELPSLLSNIFSYLRLVALGISGVIIALIINTLPVDFGGMAAMLLMREAFDAGAFLSSLAFMLMLIIGHVVALALAILESGVQSLRLHYVEFFSKFYEGGGMPFLPLRKRDK